MLFNGRALIFTFSGTQVRIAEIERLQSLLHGKMKSAMYVGCLCVCVSVYLCIIKNVSEFVRSLASRVLEIS